MAEHKIFEPWEVIDQGNILTVVKCKHCVIVVFTDNVFEKRKVSVIRVFKPPSINPYCVSRCILVNNDSGKGYLKVCFICVTLPYKVVT